MNAPVLVMAAVIFSPAFHGFHNSSPKYLPYKFRCEQITENEETFLMCERYYEEDVKKKINDNAGPKPIYHCSYTMYSHVQMGFCSDGKGAWKSTLRGSGPHPRNSVQTCFALEGNVRDSGRTAEYCAKRMGR